MSKKLRNSILLVIAAMIWGAAFVAQKTGGDIVGAYSFNCIRSLMGSLVLLPVILIIDKINPSSKKPVTKEDWKMLWLAAICCGVPLCFATNLQQVGILLGTGGGKAGFLTANYIIFVPIFSILLKKKCGWNIWLSVLIATGGLYLLCMTGAAEFHFSDLLCIFCAMCFAIQIMMVDRFIPFVDGVRLSCMQFLVSGTIGLVPMFIADMKASVPGIEEWAGAFTSLDAWIPILYAGIMSCGIAYTLQIVGQEGVNPTVASLLMSLESVFSVVFSALLLGERMSGKEYLGCVLIFVAIVLAQIPVSNLSKKMRNNTDI